MNNPVDQQLIIGQRPYSITEYIVEMYDLYGRRLISEQIKNQSRTVGFDLSHSSAGAYLIKISSLNGELYSVNKVIKVK